jgi:hypothetical protein
MFIVALFVALVLMSAAALCVIAAVPRVVRALESIAYNTRIMVGMDIDAITEPVRPGEIRISQN